MARAHTQAQKFTAELSIPEEVKALAEQVSGDVKSFQLLLRGGDVVSARSVVIASGAEYLQLRAIDGGATRRQPVDTPSATNNEKTATH